MNHEETNVAWRQIPVSTKMWLGARAPRFTGEALSFKVHSKPYRYFELKLNGLDLYDVRYYRIKRNNGEKVELASTADGYGVYADMLGEVLDRLYAEGNAA